MIEGIESRTILQPYIREGRVDYGKLRADPQLPVLVDYVETAQLENMSEKDRLAFWLNAYNIITLKSVLHYLEDNPKWEGVTSLWRKFIFFVWNKHKAAGRNISLYAIENKILRREFNDPRIHFAINCASTSCPFLPGKLFYPENLDEYLETLTYDFINNQGGVRISDETVYLSKIFKMYTDDFGGEDQLLSYVRQYWEGKIPASANIAYQDYDWSLNCQ